MVLCEHHLLHLAVSALVCPSPVLFLPINLLFRFFFLFSFTSLLISLKTISLHAKIP